MGTTSSEYDFGSTDFVETLHMSIDGELDVQEWTYNDEVKGLKIGVTFDQVAVETEDSNGDFTYYNSLAQNGDTDFDSVLQSMTGDTVTVDVGLDYEIEDEEDNSNSLSELEQEYSFGTTTGLSAIDQITQITNLRAFLPESADKEYIAGDEWDITYATDVEFQGRSTFVGWVKYNGYECAVITSWAYLDQEGDTTFGEGEDDWELESVLEIQNGNIDSTIFWDVNHNIPRFAKIQIEMTTEIDEEIEDGEEEGLEDSMELPMTETLEMCVAPMF